MKQICDPAELYKAFEKAGVLQFIADIPGEEQKQQDGTFLHICMFIIKPDVTDQKTLDTIQQVWKEQLARDWATWRVTTEQIRSIEQKSGTTRRDRELNMKIFASGDFQFNSAKMVEDQIAALRPQLKLLRKEDGANNVSS